MTRRNALRVMGGVGLGVAGVTGAAAAIGGSVVQGTPAGAAEGPAAPSATAPSCVLSAEIGDGPYYLDLDKVRRNIAEDRKGLPLEIGFVVVNAKSCAPIPNAAVDIWMCDANGVYSGYAAPDPNAPPPPPGSGFPHQEPINDDTFLRGVQITDRRGRAEFRTIYPGWYKGRALHIHVKVHVGGTLRASGYEGGHVSHTGQVFFPEATSEEVAKLAPYRSNPVPRLTNSQDAVYNRFDGASAVIALTHSRGSLRRGLSGAVTVGVNPDAAPSPGA
ncbi:MAG TPA: intradiol ring-cleavage dioxygenase [Micromonosporaceae bacterium]|nr:intradiol ring-cleavage dioxygenase [Micromonosporaceae bacterium]